jgi:hypothetical protein
MKVAKEWYEIQQENLGNEFLEETEQILIQITKNPFQFPKSQKTIRKAVMKRFPFSIFFTMHKNLVIVFAIFHNSRNPIVWKNRLR